VIRPSVPEPRRLDDLAERIGADLVGDGSIVVRGVAHPAEAGEEDLALAMDDAAFAALAGSPVRAAVVAEPNRDAAADGIAGRLVVRRPRYALARLIALFTPPPRANPGIHAGAVVDHTARIGEGVSIGPFCSIGPGAWIGTGTMLLDHVTVAAGARLGENCLVHAGVRVGERVVIGDRAILQPNAVIGADGFSFATQEAGNIEAARSGGTLGGHETRIVRVNSLGTVVLGDDVEIGAGTTIDRATLGATTIGNGTKIDNQVQVAHNCRIGEDCLIAGCCALSGSVTVGDRVVLAGRVSIADHIKVGDDAVIMAGSGLARDMPPRTVYGGYPAMPKQEKMQELLYLGRLKRMFKDMLDLKSRTDALERRVRGDEPPS